MNNSDNVFVLSWFLVRLLMHFVIVISIHLTMILNRLSFILVIHYHQLVIGYLLTRTLRIFGVSCIIQFYRLKVSSVGTRVFVESVTRIEPEYR